MPTEHLESSIWLSILLCTIMLGTREGSFLLERDNEHQSYPNSSCNNISVIPNHASVGSNVRIIARVGQIDVHKTQDNAEVDQQTCCETKLKPPPNVVAVENNWPEEDLDLIKNLLIIVLSHPAQTDEVRTAGADQWQMRCS